MFLTLLASLAFAATSTKPCKLPNPAAYNLDQYIGVSQALAAKGMPSKSVLFATAPDPRFDGDEPIEYRFVSSRSPTLTMVLVHREALSVDGGPVNVVEISDQVVIDLNGNVLGGQACEVNIAMAEAALEKMARTYGF